jgi:hypothetical protein
VASRLTGRLTQAGELSPERVERLEAVAFVWRVKPRALKAEDPLGARSLLLGVLTDS